MSLQTTARSPVSRFVLIGAAIIGLFASLALIVQADVAPTVSTTVRNAGNATLTQAAIGTSVHARAEVASSSATTSPTGTVDFYRYSNLSCTGAASVESGVALASGVAESASVSLPNTGLSYIVHYNGQSGVYSPADSVCQAIVAQSANPTLTANLSTTTVLAGLSVASGATLANTSANASGTVAYVVYTNNSCTASLQGAGVKTVTNASVPNSDSVQFNNAGSFWWKAVYSGDLNNGSATSSCLQLNVLATSTTPAPTSTLTLGGKVFNDLNKNETLDGSEAGVAGFTVKLYKGAGWWKNGNPILTATTDSNGMYSFGGLSNGTYSIELINMQPWRQETEDFNSVVLSDQSKSDLHFAVVNKTGTTTTPGTSGSIGGKVFADLDGDESLDSNEQGIAGFTINLYKGAKWPGQGKGGVFKSTTTDSNGMYSFAGLADGIYSVEEINKAGWHQDTADYKSLTIKNGAALTDIHFANSSSTPSQGNNDDDDDNDNGKGNNNGKHNGWFKIWNRINFWFNNR